MAPFSTHATGIHGIKDKIESMAVQGDRLFMGTGGGDLHIYTFQKENGGTPDVTLLETKKGFTRRSIDQLGFIKDTNSLVILSDSAVSLYSLPELIQITPLPQTRTALVFALNTAILHVLPDGRVIEPSSAPGDARAIPSIVTHLAVGCRKKVVIFTWRDGEAEEPKELTLPHSPRAIAFLCSGVACLAYTQTEHVLLSLDTMTISDIAFPSANSVTVTGLGMGMGMGMGALTGLGGYMTLGLGAKEKKPSIARIEEGEVLIPKDNSGLFIGPGGKPTRSTGIEWQAVPEEIVFQKPYVLSILPPGAMPVKTPPVSVHPGPSQSSVLQITSTISLLPVQTLVPPDVDDNSDLRSRSAYTTRLLTASSQTKGPLFMITTPVDKATAAADGSAIWMLCMQSWGQQINELVDSGSYVEALSLLDMMDQVMMPEKERRLTQIRILHAVSLFSEGSFDDAINTFIELDINPAKVVALYPDSIAGRLSTPREKWFDLHGGRPPPNFIQPDSSNVTSPQESSIVPVVETPEQPGGPSAQNLSRVQVDNFHRSVETLLRYLGDRRPKLWGALSALHISPSQASEHASLSETSIDELLDMPNAPPSALIPNQLIRFAQVVDTALFKSYLAIRPSLLGPLCRISNWCEVLEVEQVLRSRQKFSELIFLYHGKQMHGKALSLLHEMSASEDSATDKLGPTIQYLQKLGPDYLQQIFNAARWVFDTDREMAFEIFTSEETELPRKDVADFLEGIDPFLCIRYLEYLIDDRGETSSMFHERLAETYLHLSRAQKKLGNSASEHALYSKLLKFIDESQHYHLDRLFGLLPSDDMFEARAVLLGRLGKHEGALEIYVYRLQDYIKAEEYCKRLYHADPGARGIFLALLRIYLQPSTSSNLLRPALDLIRRHSPRLDNVETLDLLPPMVTAQDLNAFLCEALRDPLFDTQVVREIGKTRLEQVSTKLVGLQAKRVKVTDSRICPQCHKRIGNSVIAVHPPRGEVTHYTCREAFSRKLNERTHRHM
ncbi:vacuolar sorting protein 39 domain 1-domain-containing protein [Gautieria morchelliformis]|nr:vacuolar sorting protein 39 domain 1-domain-containing protein [Gautieria morchelliformis]